MHPWSVSAFGVVALLVVPSYQAVTGPIRPPRRPLHGDLQNIQLRDGNAQFITDWVSDAYLDCLAQDFFQTHHTELEKAHYPVSRTARTWKKIEQDCFDYAKVTVTLPDGRQYTIPVHRESKVPRTAEELTDKKQLVWTDNGMVRKRPTQEASPPPPKQKAAAQQGGRQPNAMPFADVVEGVRDSFFKYMDGRPAGATDGGSPQRGVYGGSGSGPVFAPRVRPIGH